MAEHIIEQRYETHRGIDPGTSDLRRPAAFASGMKNAQYRKSGAVEKRPGYQGHAAHVGGYGLFEYNRIDPDTEAEEPETLCVDSNLHRLTTATITVNYAGADPTAQISMFFDVDTDQYRVQILEGANTVLDFALGLGFDEASTITLADLKTAIDAVTGFSATISGTTTTPAAFLKIVRNHDLISSDWAGVAKYWTQVNSTVTNPFATYITHINDDGFENVSAAQVNNVLYLANGYNELHKYDGQTFYRAGLPTPASISSALGAAGNPNGNNYYHKAQYIQNDAAGQIIEGNLLTTSSGVNATSDKIDVTVANIQAATGFNTNCAIVAGAQVTVNTITVDDGSGGANTMKSGDKAYFYDSVSGGYVTRNVTARSATTITVDGNAVTVADNAVISNNLKIAIYRNKTSATTPTVFYLVAEIPNNSFAATQVYSDDLADASLGALLIPPLTDRSAPPKGKYVSSFQNQLVICGNLTYQRRAYWSDADGPEYFPADTNQEDIQTAQGDILKGCGPGGTVFAFMSDLGAFVLSGTLADNNIRIEQKSFDVGCSSHASIVNMGGVIAWWSKRGPYYMANGQIPQPLGLTEDGTGRMEPIMEQLGATTEEVYQQRRITSLNWVGKQKVIWFLPAESTTGGADHPNSNSRCYVYDYNRDAWLEWTNLNFASGAVLHSTELYFQERRYSTYASAVKSILYRMHNLNDAYDYQDNNEPIDWEYDTTWEAFGKPSVLKKFLQVKVYALEDLPNNSFTITVQQEINYQRDTPSAEFDIEFSGVGYGVTAYSSSPYGDSSEGSVRHDLKRTRCKSMRLKFMNNEAQQNCLMTGWEYLAAAPYRPTYKT